jgi:riboflavin kinase/FMN adenylyltransferase
MAVFFDIDHLPVFKNGVITIGTFDGVHMGHRAILQEVKRYARECGGESIMITFEPHPRKLLKPGEPLGILTPLHRKIQLITDAGIDHIVVAPFTEVFAHYSPETYIREFLVQRFRPAHIVIGYDHKFGRGRQGDIQVLRAYASESGYTVSEIPEFLVNEAAISSTKIRQALNTGDVAVAATMLGRPYSIKGDVIEGKKLGRTLGFPTANIHPGDFDQLIPATGVYAVKCLVNGHTLKGMMNVGYNPTTTSERTLKIEVHLLDFEGDLYHHQLELFFVQRMRAEQKFESLEQLTRQLEQDRLMARALLADR